MAGAAGHDALAILRTPDERSLLHSRHHAHAGRLLQNVERDAVVRSFHDLVQNDFGGIDAILQILHAGGGERAQWKHETEANRCKCLLHTGYPFHSAASGGAGYWVIAVEPWKTWAERPVNDGSALEGNVEYPGLPPNLATRIFPKQATTSQLERTSSKARKNARPDQRIKSGGQMAWITPCAIGRRARIKVWNTQDKVRPIDWKESASMRKQATGAPHRDRRIRFRARL